MQQSRHEITGRVQARAGRAAHGGHEAPHNEADHDGSGSVVRFAPRHGQAAQGAEHEHEGAEELVDEVVDAVVWASVVQKVPRMALAFSVSL